MAICGEVGPGPGRGRGRGRGGVARAGSLCHGLPLRRAVRQTASQRRKQDRNLGQNRAGHAEPTAGHASSGRRS